MCVSGKPGGVAVGYYMCTTVLAVTVGLIAVNILKPGVNKELAAAKESGRCNWRRKGKGREELNALKASIRKISMILLPVTRKLLMRLRRRTSARTRPKTRKRHRSVNKRHGRSSQS